MQEFMDEDTTGIGYSFNYGGLNNQTRALLGLFCRAYLEKQKVVLPLMMVRDNVSAEHRIIPLREVFDFEILNNLAAKYGFSLSEADPMAFDAQQVAPEKNGWAYFGAGCSKISELARGLLRDTELGAFIFDFFDHLVPLVRRAPELIALKQKVFVEAGIDVVAQFRIETDWKRHTDPMKLKQKRREDIYLGPNEIVRKILNTLPDTKVILVTSDEAAMPRTKQEIASACLDELAVKLVWKSDFLTAGEIASFNNLELSLIDMEMAVSSKHFVGITRSTFANTTTFLKFARSREQVKTDYLYNTSDDSLWLRNDNGGWDQPQLAASPWEHPHYGWPRP